MSSSVFARAVSQVAIAAGRDDTLPMLTGVRLEIDGDRLTLAATDRYRLAVRELTWNPASTAAAEAQVLVPARTLHEAARSLTGEAELTISLSSSSTGGEGIIGFSGTGRRTTTRLLDAQFPPYRTLLPQEFAVTAEVPVASLSEAVKRVALVAERGNPVRLQFADGSLTLTAGGDDEGRAEENLEAEFDRRRHHHRVQSSLSAGGPGRHRGAGGAAAVHHADQARGAAAGRWRLRLHLPDHAGAAAGMIRGRRTAREIALA